MTTIETITTSELARQGGVNLETIRYYERQGLLPKPPRTGAGYRQFPSDAVQRVRFIKRAQALGFTLAEIRELLTLRLDPAGSCHDVESRAREKISDIGERIKTLKGMKVALAQLVALCADARVAEIAMRVSISDMMIRLNSVRMDRPFQRGGERSTITASGSWARVEHSARKGLQLRPAATPDMERPAAGKAPGVTGFSAETYERRSSQ